MQRIAITSIRVGACFDQTLFLPSGQKVIPAGVVVTDKHRQMLLRQSETHAILADEFEDHHRSPAPLSDPAVYEHQAYVKPSSRRDDADLARLKKRRVEACDGMVGELLKVAQSIDLRVYPQELEVWDRFKGDAAAWPAGPELADWRQGIVEQLQSLYDRLESGQRLSVEGFSPILSELMRLLLNHRERFTQIALLVPRRDDYLPDHALTAAVLAMATAAQLAWQASDIERLGLTCLVYDLGMLLVPDHVRVGGDQLTDLDRGRVQRHTAYALPMLELIDDLPDLVRLAAYQHHEREDGTGYPEGLCDEAICDDARLLAVADVYAALSAPRNYRKDRLPYVAMEQLIRSASAGQFYKPAARALVQASGLFPVGSYVRLSTGKVAQVIACNPNHLDRPSVQMVTASGELVGDPIDLSRVPKETILIERPVPSPLAMEPVA